jgi:DNA-binding protein H-NS
MARQSSLDKMTYSQLAELRNRVDRLMAEKLTVSRTHLRDKMVSMAREHGLSIVDLFGSGRKSKRKGSVAPKYRDPNSGNTWTGRGRMPRWMVAATKGGKAKKEDFLI